MQRCFLSSVRFAQQAFYKVALYSLFKITAANAYTCFNIQVKHLCWLQIKYLKWKNRKRSSLTKKLF